MSLEFDIITFEKLDQIILEQTAFNDFDDLINAKGGYRPSLSVNEQEDGWEDRTFLADYYDAWMEKIGDDRIAFRYGTGTRTGW